jgi:hypothetical protein
MDTTPNARFAQRMTRTSPVRRSVSSSSSVVVRVATESHSATGLLVPSFSRKGATIKTG